MKMETARTRQNRDFSVKELLSWGAVHSGWLAKVERKSGFATSKKSVQRFCVIFNGELFIYADKSSTMPINNFILSNFCVEMFAEPGKAQTLTQSFYISLQCQDNLSAQSHQFACSSYWDAEKWLGIIKNEITSYYPNGEKIINDGYDYAQSKPTDISFSNPEKYDEVITNKLFAGSSNTLIDDRYQEENQSATLSVSPKSFTGPTCHLTPAVFCMSTSPVSSSFLSTSPMTKTQPTIPTSNHHSCPIPPPRPDHTKKQTNSPGHRYEVSEIDAGARGSPSKDSSDPKGAAMPILPPRITHVNQHDKLSDAVILPATVYQWNMKREKAIELLKTKNMVGTYLIRKNSDERHVLTIYTAEKQNCRHFIIFQKHGQQFLAGDPEPKFTKVGDLIRHYMKSNLPTCNIRLEQPYS